MSTEKPAIDFNIGDIAAIDEGGGLQLYLRIAEGETICIFHGDRKSCYYVGDVRRCYYVEHDLYKDKGSVI